MQPSPLQIWVVSSDYFDVGNPAREYLKTKFKDIISSGALEVRLYRREDQIKEWTKLGVYPDLVVTDGTYQVRDGEGFETATYDHCKVFPANSGTQVIPISLIEQIVLG